VEYEIISKNRSGNYKVYIKGNTDELKLWLEELGIVATLSPDGYGRSQLKNHIENLENIVEPVQFSFAINHEIQITKKAIVYMPRPSASNSRKELYFDDFMVYFNKIKKNIDKKNIDSFTSVQNI
jgi:hypothetical protein